jgi:hypothetical protein
MGGIASTSTDPRDPPCPIRPGELCHLCHPGSSGPDSCGLVYLVMTDPELRAELEQLWAALADRDEPAPTND